MLQFHCGKTSNSRGVQCRGGLVSLQNWKSFGLGGLLSCGSVPALLAQTAAGKMLWCLPHMLSSSSLLTLAGKCLDPAAPSSDTFLDLRTSHRICWSSAQKGLTPSWIQTSFEVGSKPALPGLFHLWMSGARSLEQSC